MFYIKFKWIFIIKNEKNNLKNNFLKKGSWIIYWIQSKNLIFIKNILMLFEWKQYFEQFIKIWSVLLAVTILNFLSLNNYNSF